MGDDAVEKIFGAENRNLNDIRRSCQFSSTHPAVMKIFRVALALLALGCLAGWLWLRKPYSPTQDIPAVTLTAFTVHAPSRAAGHALAEAARGWEGMTAATYNPASDILALTHWVSLHENDLQRGLQLLASQPIERKVFPELTGAKCPVPQAMLATWWPRLIFIRCPRRKKTTCSPSSAR